MVNTFDNACYRRLIIRLVLIGATFLVPIRGQSRVYSYIDENGHRIITNIPFDHAPINTEELVSNDPDDNSKNKGKSPKSTSGPTSKNSNTKALNSDAARQAIERAEQRVKASERLAVSADRLAAQLDAQPLPAAQKENLEQVAAESFLPIPVSNYSWTAQVTPAYHQYLESLITKYSDFHGLEPDLVRAVIKTESNFNPLAVSSKGARGLMQLMPDTARRYGVQRIHDPEENIAGGTRYLRDLLDMFQGSIPLALSGYNAGENRVLRTGGIPNISETRNYVNRVSRIFGFDRSPFTPVTDIEPPPAPRVRRFINAQGLIEITNLESSEQTSIN